MYIYSENYTIKNHKVTATVNFLDGVLTVKVDNITQISENLDNYTNFENGNMKTYLKYLMNNNKILQLIK